MRPRDIVILLYVPASVYVYSLAQNRQDQGRLGTMRPLVSHEHTDAATINCFYNNILSRLNLLLNKSCIQSGTVAIRSRALHSTYGKNSAIFYTNRLAVVLICYFFCLAIWSGEFIPREAELSRDVLQHKYLVSSAIMSGHHCNDKCSAAALSLQHGWSVTDDTSA